MITLKDSVGDVVLKNQSKIEFTSDLKRFLLNDLTEAFGNYTDVESVKEEAARVVELIEALQTIIFANELSELEKILIEADYSITEQ